MSNLTLTYHQGTNYWLLRRFATRASLLSAAIYALSISGAAAQSETSNAIDDDYLPFAASGSWTLTGNLAQSRAAHTATLLRNGKVLVAGGSSTQVGDLNSAEIYNPVTGRWSSTGSLATIRAGHTATLLRNGKVLIVGGTT